MPHDIIDNRREKLLDHIKDILPSSERARCAVGYLFLSGLKPIREHLKNLKEVRLLIGSTTDRETLETLAEAYKRLDLAQDAAEAIAFPKRTEMQQALRETAANLAEAVALMDQTDEDEETVRTVLRLIEEKRLKVRTYTKGRLHAKAYIFDYGKIYDLLGKEIPRVEKGIAVVGSSNLTLAGVSHNTELNVLVHGNQNHEQLVSWFDELWEEGQDFDAYLMNELKRSWAIGVVDERDGVITHVRPYDIYMKTLYELVKDRLEEEAEIVLEDDITRALTDFQKDALRRAIRIIRRYGGCFIADVVGLGKSYIGAAIVKHFEQSEGIRPLIICPASLVEMWERYNEVYQLNARVLSMGLLRESDDGHNFLLEEARYRERDFVLIDESHNFRYSDTQRYRVIQSFLHAGRRRCVLLTATPRNKSALDLYHQIKLFHPEERTLIAVAPPNLREYFRKVEDGEKRLQDLLVHILIRRTRNHVLRWYGYDAETGERVDPHRFQEYSSGARRAYIMVNGRRQFFPRRELQTVTYSIESTYQGLYQQLRGYMGRPRSGQVAPPPDELTYARYGLWHYILPNKRRQSPYAELHRAGANLRGLMRVLLFKRFESSVYAFRETLKRLIRIHKDFLMALDEGIVPAGEEAQSVLYESDEMEETQFLDALRELSSKYNLADFQADLLREHIEQDIRILGKMLELVEPITPGQDAKLQKLIGELKRPPLADGKRLIFTQYSDTARYLYENINPQGERGDIDVVYSGNISRERLVGRFAPKANPWYRLREGETELNTVIATDVLAEGLNLQDCDKVINYDLHWNPVRLIQRFGRIDRIGSEYDRIYAYNFLPETGIEQQLGLRQILEARIREIHDTIGEDAAILDPTEQLNEEAMYAIYEGQRESLARYEMDDEDVESLDLDEAAETFRLMRQENPAEYERIANLRDGLRTGRASQKKGIFAFFRGGRYLQPCLLDNAGNEVSRDLSEVLARVRCDPDEPGLALPEGYNASLMIAKRRFDEEAKGRVSQRDYTATYTDAQRYVLRELRGAFGSTKDEVGRAEMSVLERAFSQPLTSVLKKELNWLRRNQVTGDALLQQLKRIYYQHNLKDAGTLSRSKPEEETPRVVCSMALV